MKHLAGAVVNTPVQLAGAQEFSSIHAGNQLLLNDPSCRAGELRKLLPYGDWEIEELSPHQ